MSGSFEDMDVPPTLVSFAVTPGRVEDVVTPELKRAGDRLALLHADPFDAEATLAMFTEAEGLMRAGKVRAAWAVGAGGIAEGLCKMAFGNALGVELDAAFEQARLFGWSFGTLLVETEPDCAAGETIGRVTADYALSCGGESAPLDAVQDAWEATLEPVMPELSAHGQGSGRVKKLTCDGGLPPVPGGEVGAAPGAHPRLPRHELRVRHGARPAPCRRGAGDTRHPQPQPRGRGRERGARGGGDSAQPDDSPARRLFGRRRAGRQRQAHSELFPQPAPGRRGPGAARTPGTG